MLKKQNQILVREHELELEKESLKNEEYLKKQKQISEEGAEYQKGIQFLDPTLLDSFLDPHRSITLTFTQNLDPTFFV